jgi:hypothetical protein
VFYQCLQYPIKANDIEVVSVTVVLVEPDATDAFALPIRIYIYMLPSVLDQE